MRGGGRRSEQPTAPNVLRVDNGRALSWTEYGATTGRPVVACHGTPSSRLDFAPLAPAAADLGLRLIAPDRPGTGGSSPAPGRTMLGWAADLAALADHLGIGEFGALGFSGGGPYALACAHALPDRVRSVVGASAAGPVHEPGSMAGMGMTDRILTWLSLHAPLAGRGWLRGMALGARLAPGLAVRAEAAVLSPNATDVLKLLGSPAEILAPFLEAVRQGTAGPIEDFAIVSRPWGFDLDAVKVPVVLFHGTADRVVPLIQARHLHGEIPGARLIEVDGAGHLLLYQEPQRLLEACLG